MRYWWTGRVWRDLNAAVCASEPQEVLMSKNKMSTLTKQMFVNKVTH